MMGADIGMTQLQAEEHQESKTTTKLERGTKDPSSRGFRESTALPTPDFGFLAPELQENKAVLF